MEHLLQGAGKGVHGVEYALVELVFRRAAAVELVEHLAVADEEDAPGAARARA